MDCGQTENDKLVYQYSWDAGFQRRKGLLSAWARGKSDCLCLSSRLSVSPSVSDCALVHCPSPIPAQWSWGLCCYCSPLGGENWAPHSISQLRVTARALQGPVAAVLLSLLFLPAFLPHPTPAPPPCHSHTPLTGAQGGSGWFRVDHGPPRSQVNPLAAGEEHHGEVLTRSPQHYQVGPVRLSMVCCQPAVQTSGLFLLFSHIGKQPLCPTHEGMFPPQRCSSPEVPASPRPISSPCCPWGSRPGFPCGHQTPGAAVNHCIMTDFVTVSQISRFSWRIGMDLYFLKFALNL